MSLRKTLLFRLLEFGKRKTSWYINQTCIKWVFGLKKIYVRWPIRQKIPKSGRSIDFLGLRRNLSNWNRIQYMSLQRKDESMDRYIINESQITSAEG
jgi:hypothetical protein